MEDLYAKGAGREQERRTLSVEQKLELSHMLRQEEDGNRLRMDRREMLVYGRVPGRMPGRMPSGGRNRYGDRLKSGYGRTSMLHAAEQEDAEEEAAWQRMRRRNRASFMARSLISAFLFVVVLLMRFSGFTLRGVDYGNLIDSLRDEEFINGIAFEDIIITRDGEKNE